MGYQLYAFSNYGVLTFVPITSVVAPTGVDVSTGILIAHGWLYVLYLFSDFRLWSLMRWNAVRFVTIALGGVIPFLSFFVEARINRQVKAYLVGHSADESTLVEASH
jgi:integral membrane protein